MADTPGAAAPATAPTTATSLLRRAVWRHRRRVVPFMVFLMLWQLCETAVPVAVGLVIDRAVLTSDTTALAWGCAGIALLFAALAASYRIGSRLGFTAVQREMHLIRTEVAARCLDPRLHRVHRPGEVLSLCTGDAANIGFAIRALGYTVADIGSLVFAAVVLVRIDLVLGLVVLIGTPLVLAGIHFATPVLASRTQAHEATLATASGAAADQVEGLRVLRGIGAEARAARRYADISTRARDAGVASARSYGSVLGLTSGASGLLGALIAGVAAFMAVDGRISVGELVTVVGLSQFLVEPTTTLGRVLAQFAQARGSAQRVVDFLSSTSVGAAGDRTPTAPAPLRVAGVRTPPWQHLDLTSEPGELLGVCVPDPVAAADFVRLLSEGADGITLGCVPVLDVPAPARPTHLVVAPHHVDLFAGTVRSNVDPFGAWTKAELDALLAATCVEADPTGRGEEVTAGGRNWSGGQRQRISLARALASRATTVVLHDPTTAVDSVTEQRLADAVRSVRHGADSALSTWLVTSSPALLATADRVVLVIDGAVVASGTHGQLTAVGAYREAVLR